MLALRNGSVFLVCALGVGCFLDEKPHTESSSEAQSSEKTGGSARTGSARSGFVPRDPSVTTGRTPEMDAGVPPPAAELDASVSTTHFDAAQTATQGAAGGPADAGVSHPSDAHVALDAATSTPDAAKPPPRDAQVPQDAATVDAHVAKDATVRILPRPIHRYDFSGTGRVAVDRIGDADGQLRGSSFLDGSGAVEFPRAEEVGVELPTGLMAELTAFSIVGWLDVRSEECWQRLFDFMFIDKRQGGNGNGNGNREPTTQASALFLSPFGCPDGLPTAGYVTEQTNYRVDGTRKLLRPRGLMLGLIYDDETRILQLIVDGVVQQQGPVPINLRELARSSAGLGRSYHQDDPALDGSITEFRIYAQTLDAATLTELAQRGPDRL